jgi:hypothetical protein
MLEKGDVFKIEHGMRIIAVVPEKFFIGNRKFSNKKCSHDIFVGKLYVTNINVEPATNRIINSVMEAFKSEGAVVSLKDATQFVEDILPKVNNDSFCFQEGFFVVTETKMDGGGTGHGPHDIYPDGHHVFAQRLNEDGTYNEHGEKINFYQSGSFTTCIEEDIPVIRKMKETKTFV